MKKTMLSLILACLSLTSQCQASIEGERFLQSEEAVKTATYGHIDARGLKALIDSGVSFVLLDARGNQWHDGNMLPGAALAWYEDSAEDFQRIIPNEETLVVVYCFSFTCPLSPRLATKLVELGYQNVVEYPAGLKEWRDIANYPVDIIPVN
ncbi:MAG: rhodanese-like domain-containing protein [Chlamydiales bacterium]